MAETLAVVLILAVLGLVFGSFIAAVSVRLPAGEDVVFAPSRCRSCEASIRPWNLIPVFSWLALRGRCAACGAAISRRYPLIETGAALIGVWAGLNGQGWMTIAATAVLGWQLLLIAVVDGEHFWLPDVLTWPLAVTGLIGAWLLGGAPGLIAGGVGVVVGFCLLWLLAFAYRRVRGRDGLGGGDPFLFGAAGAWVGWTGLPSVLLWACIAAFSLVAARVLLRRAVRGDDRLPFGVFLAIGVWLTWLYGPLGMSG